MEEEGPGSRIEIKKWTGVALWSWNVQVDNCGICRNHIMENCIDCEGNADQTGCPRVQGQCNHTFHKHCIDRWLQTKQTCPLDQRPWADNKQL